jgi:hypothetical protein
MNAFGRLENRLYVMLGSDWGGNPNPPMNEVKHYTETNGFRQVYRIGNDGFELWVGTPDKWYWHTNRQGARELWWFILRWRLGEWFGLRRWFWYRLLHRRVERHQKWMAEST